MATAHILFGYIGSGKTTLAKALELRHGAVRFTPDDWMARLFGEDPPADIFQEKAAAILSLMQPLWTRCLSQGVDVVLDFGFWRRSERDEARNRAVSLGAAVKLYKCACSDDEALARIAARNRGEHGLFIAPETFEALKARFEPLQPDESQIAEAPTSGPLISTKAHRP